MHSILSFNANDIFEPEIVDAPAYADFLNIKLNIRNLDKRGGCGVYSMYYKKRLIYVGSYLGTKANPLAGNIFGVRWNKHLYTMTMRGYLVSLAVRPWERIRDCALSNANVLGDITDPIFHKARGNPSSANRAYFALQHWDEFMDPNFENTLSDFEFVYAQYHQDTIEAARNVTQLRKQIKLQENCMTIMLRPICNRETDVNDANANNTVEDFESAFLETARCHDLL